MEANEKLVGILNDLIQINNDRVTGYEKAAEEAKKMDVDLETIFYEMSDESTKYVAELTQEVARLGGKPTTGTTNSGKIYRVWMDIKATFAGKDRKAILDSCEFGEDSAQKAYNEALASDVEINPFTRQLITQQQASLKTSHDIIKKFRDRQRAVNL